MYLQQLRAGKPTSVCVFVCFSGFTMQELHYCRRQLLVMHLRRFFSVRLQRATSRDVKSYISKPTRRCYCSWCCWWLWWWLYSVLHPSFYLRITFMLDQLCKVNVLTVCLHLHVYKNACESRIQRRHFRLDQIQDGDRRPSWKTSNGHISATYYAIHCMYVRRPYFAVGL